MPENGASCLIHAHSPQTPSATGMPPRFQWFDQIGGGVASRPASEENTLPELIDESTPPSPYTEDDRSDASRGALRPPMLRQFGDRQLVHPFALDPPDDGC